VVANRREKVTKGSAPERALKGLGLEAAICHTGPGRVGCSRSRWKEGGKKDTRKYVIRSNPEARGFQSLAGRVALFFPRAGEQMYGSEAISDGKKVGQIVGGLSLRHLSRMERNPSDDVGG